ncbi:MAG: TlpA family protein disulfide reductase [Gammaproteobacteria bacterium]|nr:TlpA family protein disulfide reductase [Gammaproteobacteria bacterium]
MPTSHSLRSARRALALLLMLSLVPLGDAAGPDPLDLPGLRGKVVYVDFWASWCAPCRQSFPWMDGLARDLGPRGLVVIAVNVDHQRADADRFLSEFTPSFRVSFDPGGNLAQRFHVSALPMSFLIDREGHQVMEHAGFRAREEPDLQQRITAALAQR